MIDRMNVEIEHLNNLLNNKHSGHTKEVKDYLNDLINEAFGRVNYLLGILQR